MPERVKEFIKGIGILTETWMVTYNSFTAQGLDHAKALAHTQGFMTAFISSIMTTANNNKEENTDG